MEELIDTKVCTYCKKSKTLNCFYNRLDYRTEKPRIVAKCKECVREKQRIAYYVKKGVPIRPKWKIKGQKAIKPEVIRNKKDNKYPYPSQHKKYKKAAYLKCVYNITLDRFDQLLSLQEGKCAICKRDFYKEAKNPQVDHDHITGVVRGLLCWNCNTAIGHLHEDEVAIENALKYIQLYKNLK